MKYLKIRHWSKWQSYRSDRSQPPWIKLHRCVMRCPEWVALSDGEKGQLVSIWMLAADREGEIPADPLVIKRLCHMDTVPNLEHFIEQEFIEYDANVTPTGSQDDANVTQQTRLDKTRLEDKTPCTKPNGSAHATSIDFEKFWNHWPIKINKKTAKTAFMRKKFESTDIDILIADITERMKNDEKWKGGYIPLCSTYLNGDRWEDEYGNKQK